MQSSKGIRSKGRGPLAGLAVGAALTLGIALVPGAWGPAFGDSTPGGGGGGGGAPASGGVNISNSAGPGQTATGSAGQSVTITGAGTAGGVGGDATGHAVFPGICSFDITSPVNVDVTASIAGPNAYNTMIQPGSALGPGQNVLAAVTCHVTPPVSGLPPMVWYTPMGGPAAGQMVNVDPMTVSATANADGSWEVKISPVNVNDFANGGAVLHFV